MKTGALLGSLALGVLASAVIFGGKKAAPAPSPDALFDGVWVFDIQQGDAQASRVLNIFEQFGQVIEQSWDGSMLGIKARVPRRWSTIAREGGPLQQEFDVGLSVMVEPE